MTEHRPTITVTKHGHHIPISCCAAGTCAPGDHPTPPRLPWHTRAHLRLTHWWYTHRPHLHLGPCHDPEDYL